MVLRIFRLFLLLLVIVVLIVELLEVLSLILRGFGVCFEEGVVMVKVVRVRDVRNFMVVVVCLFVCCLGGSLDGL